MHIVLSILGILLFIGLIIAHEWGHFYAARKNGVEVEEFGLGFPPRMFGRKLKSGMILSYNWLPLGGFVKLKGEHDADKHKGSFGAAPLAAKTQIMLAGVTMNLLIGLLILTALALSGMPKLIDNQFTVAGDTKTTLNETRIGAIGSGSPAARAGLAVKDKVNTVTCTSCHPQVTKQIDSAATLRATTKSFAGQQVVVNVTRDAKGSPPLTFNKTVTLNTKAQAEAGKGYIGVEPVELQLRRSTWSAPIVAVGITGQLTQLTFKGIGTALAGLGKAIVGLVTVNTTARQNGQEQATEQTGGIVAIVNIIWASGSLGVSFMLVIIAILSLTLAIMNVLPIPALDGGRLFVTLLFRGLKKPLTRELEERIHGTGMAVLLTLFLLITIVDVKRFY